MSLSFSADYHPIQTCNVEKYMSEKICMLGFSLSSQEDLLGGVWQFRQVADDISLGEEDEDSQTDTDVTDTDSAISTPVPEAEMAFFDPMKAGTSTEQKEGEQVSNEWLLSKMAVLETEVPSDGSLLPDGNPMGEEYLTCTVTPGGESLEVEMTGSRQDVLQQLLLDSQEADQPDRATASKQKPGCVVERGSGDLTASPMHQRHKLLSPADTPSPIHSPLQAEGGASPQSLIGMNLREKADYILMAANQISLAQQCEANGNYQLAFSYYKSGVGILLTGVQSKYFSLSPHLWN